MDIATIFGFVVSAGLVCTALMLGGSIMDFFNIPSLLIVIGGTIGAVLTQYPFSTVIKVGSLVSKTLVTPKPSTVSIINEIISFANRARREGVLSLESSVGSLSSAYMRKGMQLAVDGVEPEAIQGILEAEISNTEARHETGIELLGAFASYAPALGMIGTVIGLVQMLKTMDDPSSIGPAMAVALITTFYGVVLANLVFLPIKGKLQHRSREELTLMELQMEGLLGIAKGENPRILLEKLSSYQSPRERQKAG